jgi:hypothetical protein
MVRNAKLENYLERWTSAEGHGVVVANHGRSTWASDARKVAEGFADHALKLVFFVTFGRFVDHLRDLREIIADHCSGAKFSLMHLANRVKEPAK